MRVGDLSQQLAVVDDDVAERWASTCGASSRAARPATAARSSTRAEYVAFADEWGVRRRMPKDGFFFDPSSAPLGGEIDAGHLARFAWPDGGDPARRAGVAEEARRVVADEGRAVYVGSVCAGLTEMLFRLRGFEDGYMDLAADPALARALMERVLEIKLAWWGGVLPELGDAVDVVGEADDLGGQATPLFSPRTYRELVKPLHAELFAFIRARTRAKVFFHSCGAIRELLPDLVEIGVDILNPVQVSAAGMETAALKRDFGRDLVFWGGGVDTQGVLGSGTPDDGPGRGAAPRSTTSRPAAASSSRRSTTSRPTCRRRTSTAHVGGGRGRTAAYPLAGARRSPAEEPDERSPGAVTADEVVVARAPRPRGARRHPGGSSCATAGSPRSTSTATEAGGPFVAPGFVDVHVHGRGGHDAMGPEGALDGMARALLRHGVTSFLPTAVTAPLAELAAFAERVRRWIPVAPDDGAGPARVQPRGAVHQPVEEGRPEPGPHPCPRRGLDRGPRAARRRPADHHHRPGDPGGARPHPLAAGPRRGGLAGPLRGHGRGGAGRLRGGRAHDDAPVQRDDRRRPPHARGSSLRRSSRTTRTSS